MSTDEGRPDAGVVDGEPETPPADTPPPQAPEAPAEDHGDPADHGALRFWHREHPVSTPLAGFFTGVGSVVVVLALGWLLDTVVGYDLSAHPWVLLVAIGVLLVVAVSLLVRPGSRRFARYLLLGMLLTPLVIGAVAAITTYLLLEADR